MTDTDEATVRYWLGDRDDDTAEVRHLALDRIITERDEAVELVEKQLRYINLHAWVADFIRKRDPDLLDEALCYAKSKVRKEVMNDD